VTSVDRTTGRAMSTACFEDPAAMEANRDAGNQIRITGACTVGGIVTEVVEFELAVDTCASRRCPEWSRVRS